MERLSMWLVSRGMEHTVETISSKVWSSRSTGQLSEVGHRWGLTVPASRADSPNKLVELAISENTLYKCASFNCRSGRGRLVEWLFLLEDISQSASLDIQ